MELKIFLRMLVKRRWIILIILAITLLGTLILTVNQPTIYSSATTYVVSPSSDVLNGTGFLSGLSVLGGQPTVVNTYASIAVSSLVKQKASEALGLTPAQIKDLLVVSRVQTGTNVIEITVEGTDPLLAQAFATRIGESMIEYVRELRGVYDLKLLDTAIPPEKPIRPNLKLNMLLGAALGLILGIGIAFLIGIKDY